MKQLKISYILFFLLLLFLCVLAVGCQKSQPVDVVPVSPTPVSATETMVPTKQPTPTLTEVSTEVPAETPTLEPTVEPTEVPTETPTETPSATPTIKPSPTATPVPTPKPTIPRLPVEPTAIPDTIDPTKPMVALSFDDGPTKTVTNRILDVLEQYNAKATFFVVGNRLEYKGSPATITRAYTLGCEIGNHSYTHPKLNQLSASAVQTEISKTRDAITKITGVVPTLVRPPYGFVNDTVRAYSQAPLIFWSVDSEDWKSRNAVTIYNRIMSRVKDGDIILMHDLYSSTAEACEALIPALLAEGYQLVTVSELFACKGITLTTGDSYRKAR